MGKRRRVFITSIAGAAPTYTISGTVYDADGTTAVASATVALGALSTTSAANGTYTISDIPAGTSGSMTCTKSGYSWTAKIISAMSGNLTGQNYTNAWWAAAGCAGSAIQAFSSAAVSYAESKINLVTPGILDLIDTGHIPNWEASGWTMSTDGAGKYFDTGYTPAAGDYTIVIKYATWPGSGFFFGSFPTSETGKMSLRNTTGTTLRFYQPNTGDVYNYASMPSAGTFGICKSKFYLDGVSIANPGRASLGSGAVSLYLGAAQNSGGVLLTTFKIVRYAIYTGILSDAQLAAVTNP